MEASAGSRRPACGGYHAIPTAGENASVIIAKRSGCHHQGIWNLPAAPWFRARGPGCWFRMKLDLRTRLRGPSAQNETDGTAPQVERLAQLQVEIALVGGRQQVGTVDKKLYRWDLPRLLPR